MESRVINLVGSFSAELGSQFYLELKSILSSPHLVLVDAEKLDSIDEIGWEFLKKTLIKVKESNSKIAICNLNSKWMDLWNIHKLTLDFPIFANRSEGKSFLESQISIPVEKKSGEISHSNQNSNESKPVFSSSPNTSLYCPHCDSILRTYKMGINSCPSCKGKFYLHPNYKISSFEKVV